MKTIYIAYDGTEFNNKDACVDYEEENKRRDLEHYYYNLSRIRFTYDDIISGASDEIGYDVIHIRDEKDIEILNRVYSFKGKSNYVFNNSHIGKNIIFEVDFCDEFYFNLYEPTFEDFKTNMERKLATLTDQLKEALEN